MDPSNIIPVDSYLKTYLAQNQPQSQSAIPTPQQQPQGQQPNTLERLLPTIGSIGGGILGDLLPGGPITGMAGAAGGGAFGKWLENKLTGQSDANGVGGSALEGAIGQGVSGVGGAVAKGAQAVLGKVVAPLAEKGATKLVQGQFAKGTLGADEANALLSKYGISDVRQVPQIASQVTGSAQGSGAALNKGVEQALMTSGKPVDVTGLISEKGGPGMVNDLVNNETAVGANAGNKIIQTVNKSVQNMMGGNSGSIGSQAADPLDVFQQAKVFEKLGADAADKATRTGNAEQAGVANVYKNLADELHMRAFTPGGVAVPLTDEIKGQIIDGLSSVKDINPKAYAQLTGEVSNAQNAADLRPLQSLWVRANQAFDKTAKIENMGGGTSASTIAAGTAPLAVATPHGLLASAAGVALKSQPADRAGAAALNKLSDFTSKAAASKIIPALVKSGTLAMTNAPNDVASPNGASLTNNLTQGGTTPGATMQPQQNPLNELYQTLLSQEQSGAGLTPGSGNLVSALQAITPMIQKQQLAQPVISNLEQSFNNAGGAQGLGGGLVSKFTGLIPGTAANTYQNQQTSAAATLAQLLGISPAEAATMLPNVMQSPSTAAPAFNTLNGIFGGIGTGPSAIPIR